MRKSIIVMLAFSLLCGCAQHRLIVPEPNPVGAPVTVASSAFFFGAKQPRTVAECPSNAIDEVRIHQNIGQSLINVLTLGLWMQTKIEYWCAKQPSSVGSTGDES